MNKIRIQTEIQGLFLSFDMSKFKRIPPDPRTPLEINRTFIQSGQDWLIREAVAWAKANRDSVEIAYDEEGTPIDLEVIAE